MIVVIARRERFPHVTQPTQYIGMHNAFQTVS